MATAKTKKTVKRTSKPKTAKAVTTKTVVSDNKNEGVMKGFFARKGDPNENILTIFKSPRIYGAIIGEIIGTMLLAMLMLTLGIAQPIYVFLGIFAITMAIHGISGAHLNPIITVGSMATRRVSAIRGVLYIVAQIVGAWLGLVVASAFLKGGESGMELPTMAKVENFWAVTLIEALGAIVFAFFFARAYAQKCKSTAYALVVAGGFTLAVLFAYIISVSFFSMQNNFIINPAVAIMYQIFPSSGDFGAICSALATYVIIPMVAGVIGFYLADIASRLSGEQTCCDSK